MKIGDTEPVYMAGQVVAQAKVAEFDAETATLIIPATRVVMAVRTSLQPAAPEVPETTGNQHVMLGLENENPVSEVAVVGGEPIEVQGQPQVANTGAASQPAQQVEAVEGAPETVEAPAQSPAIETGATPRVESAEPVEGSNNGE